MFISYNIPNVSPLKNCKAEIRKFFDSPRLQHYYGIFEISYPESGKAGNEILYSAW